MKKGAKDKTTMTAGEVAVLVEDLRSQFRVFGEELKSINRRTESIETTTARTWEKITGMNLRLIKVETKVEKIDTRLITVEKKVEAVDTRLIKVETKIEETLQNHSERLTHLEATK